MMRLKKMALATLGSLLVAAFFGIYFHSTPAEANPNYASQTGLQCLDCHLSIPNSGAQLYMNDLHPAGQNFATCGDVNGCSSQGAAPTPGYTPTTPQGYPAPPPNYSSFNARDPDPLWFVQVRGTNGFIDMVWTRRPGTYTYDVILSNNGQVSTDVLTYEGINVNGEVSFLLTDNKSRFTGLVTSDGSHVFGGNFVGLEWMATLRDD